MNLGRDTDCIAAVASGISGALTGAGSIPDEWVRQVDAATLKNQYTNTQRSLAEHAEGLLTAYTERLKKYRNLYDMMRG